MRSIVSFYFGCQIWYFFSFEFRLDIKEIVWNKKNKLEDCFSSFKFYNFEVYNILFLFLLLCFNFYCLIIQDLISVQNFQKKYVMIEVDVIVRVVSIVNKILNNVIVSIDWYWLVCDVNQDRNGQCNSIFMDLYMYCINCRFFKIKLIIIVVCLNVLLLFL